MRINGNICRIMSDRRVESGRGCSPYLYRAYMSDPGRNSDDVVNTKE